MSSIKVVLLQTSIQWLNPSQNFAQLEQSLAGVSGVDLIVLPETFATGFAFDQAGVAESAEHGPALVWLKKMALQTGAVMTGSVAVSVQDKTANRLYWVTPSGEVSYYDKRHLFRMGNEHEYVVPGQVRQVFTLKGCRVLPIICYDLRFPVWSRNRNDYDVLLCVANWPSPRRHIWDLLARARAVENQCYVLAVNRIGDDGKGVGHNGGTAVYDFKGDTLASAVDDHSGVIEVSLDLAALAAFKQQFPAYLDGDDFTVNMV